MKWHHYMTKAEFKKKKNVSKILLTALLKCEYLEIFTLQHWSDVIHRRVSQYFPVAKNAALLLSHNWFLKGIHCFKLTVYTCMQKLFSESKTIISDDNDADVLTCIYYSTKCRLWCSRCSGLVLFVHMHVLDTFPAQCSCPHKKAGTDIHVSHRADDLI